MDLQALEDLIALVEGGSVTAAASRRNITQPAFSRRLKAIEAALGIAVIKSGSRPARPSNTLMQNLDGIRSLAFSLRRLQVDMVGAASTERTLAIAALHSIAVAHLPAILPHLNECLPFSRVHLRAADRDQCFAWLMTGQVALMLTFETAQTPQRANADLVERVVLCEDLMVPVTASSSRESDLIAASRTGALKLIGYPDGSVLGGIARDEILAQSMARFALVAVTAFSSAAMELCERGLGIAWLPQSMVNGRLKQGQLTQLRDRDLFPVAPMNLTLLRARARNTPYADAAWEQMQQYYRV